MEPASASSETQTWIPPDSTSTYGIETDKNVGVTHVSEEACDAGAKGGNGEIVSDQKLAATTLLTDFSAKPQQTCDYVVVDGDTVIFFFALVVPL